MEEQVSLQAVLKYLKKKGSFCIGDQVIPRIETGIAGYDYLMGGGFPRGKIVEAFGLEGSGKTTLAAETARAFIEQDLATIFLDYEQSADLGYFKKIGVTPNSSFLFDQPTCLESGFDAAEKLIKTGKIGLVIIDSVAALVPQAELDGTIADTPVGIQARKVSQTLRRWVGLLNKYQTGGLFLNQFRQRIGGWDVKFNPYTTTGGMSLKFYSSVRFEVKKLAYDKEDASKTVSNHRLLLKKNKSAWVQFGSVEFSVDGFGIRKDDHLRKCLLNYDLLKLDSKDRYVNVATKKVVAKDEEAFLQLLKDPEELSYFLNYFKTSLNGNHVL